MTPYTTLTLDELINFAYLRDDLTDLETELLDRLTMAYTELASHTLSVSVYGEGNPEMFS